MLYSDVIDFKNKTKIGPDKNKCHKQSNEMIKPYAYICMQVIYIYRKKIEDVKVGHKRKRLSCI